MTLVDSPLERLSEDALFDGIEHLLQTVASPALVQAFAAVDAAPEGERPDRRRQLASVGSFRALGVPVPDELRVCLRAFEAPGARSEDFDLDVAPTIFNSPVETETWCISLGILVCVTWGKTYTFTDRLDDGPLGETAEAIIKDATVPGGATVGETRDSLRAIASYTSDPAFRSVLAELYDLPPEKRAEFVKDVVLDPAELAGRGACPPDGIVVQRSSFEDQRPTLFCVSRKLSRGGAKVTITFDSDRRSA